VADASAGRRRQHRCAAIRRIAIRRVVERALRSHRATCCAPPEHLCWV